MPVELPADLLRPIIAHVNQNKDLCSLSLVSASFREEAQQALFKTTAIIINGSTHPLLDAVIASPNRLALMIKKATIHVHLAADAGKSDYGGDRGEAYTRWSEEAGPQTRKALKLMNQLESLRVSCNVYDHWHSQLRSWIESFLEGCELRLKALVWEVIGFNLKNLVLKNLANQPDMIFLSICCEYWPNFNLSEIRPDLVKVCTGLHTLSATWEVICLALENGAVIPHLEVVSRPEYIPLATAALRKALGRVECLWSPVSLQSLGVGIFDLKNLVVLQVQWLSEEDCAHISALAKLEVLILLSNWRSSVQSSEALATMVKTLFQSSTNLKTIYVEHFQDPVTPHPDRTIYMYDSATGEVETRPIFRHEMDLWRRKSRFDLADTPQLW